MNKYFRFILCLVVSYSLLIPSYASAQSQDETQKALNRRR